MLLDDFLFSTELSILLACWGLFSFSLFSCLRLSSFDVFGSFFKLSFFDMSSTTSSGSVLLVLFLSEVVCVNCDVLNKTENYIYIIFYRIYICTHIYIFYKIKKVNVSYLPTIVSSHLFSFVAAA